MLGNILVYSLSLLISSHKITSFSTTLSLNNKISNYSYQSTFKVLSSRFVNTFLQKFFCMLKTEKACLNHSEYSQITIMLACKVSKQPFHRRL